MSTTQNPPEKAVLAKRQQKRKGANYAHIHRNALPLEVHPLPAFHPTNPLSLLQLVWTYLYQWARPPSSSPAQKYVGYLSKDTRSIHVTDPQQVRALWEQGFFGKGSLSRSEPTWIDRERARLAARSQGGLTAEEATRARREERRLFKLERARLEREKIETQRKIEQGLPINSTEQPPVDEVENQIANVTVEEQLSQTSIDPLVAAAQTEPIVASIEVEPLAVPVVEQQEHLQLTLEEAFFLSFGLGVLSIYPGATAGQQDLSIDTKVLLDTLQRTSKYGGDSSMFAMDDQFILNYVVYHHFRSLGWVVRPGVKFSVDYLLYNRGPVFSHAEFAILIMPSYSDKYWHSGDGLAQRKLKDNRDWWWLHCINRVQSQVKKTLVLCYVDIPPPQQNLLEEQGVAAFLRKYKVREFIVRRWLMNRSRD